MNLGVLASHEGTTLQSLLDAFADRRIQGRVAVVVSNNGDSGAIVRQCRGAVFSGDSVDELKARVRAREKEFVVETLGQIANGEIRLVAGSGVARSD